MSVFVFVFVRMIRTAADDVCVCKDNQLTELLQMVFVFLLFLRLCFCMCLCLCL